MTISATESSFVSTTTDRSISSQPLAKALWRTSSQSEQRFRAVHFGRCRRLVTRSGASVLYRLRLRLSLQLLAKRAFPQPRSHRTPHVAKTLRPRSWRRSQFFGFSPAPCRLRGDTSLRTPSIRDPRRPPNAQKSEVFSVIRPTWKRWVWFSTICSQAVEKHGRLFHLCNPQRQTVSLGAKGSVSRSKAKSMICSGRGENPQRSR